MNILEFLFHRRNDLTSQFLPDALFFKESILAGKFPVWNPWIFGGMPYFLDPQNFLWYPPNYLLLFLPLEIGFLILLIGHLIFAGWGVKKVLGIFGIFGKLAILGSLLFVFSPKIISHLEEGNWSLLIADCWLPALYWALKNKKRWWITVSLSAIIINNLNIGYYAVLFAVLYLVTVEKHGLLGSLKLLIAIGSLTIPRWLPLMLWGNLTVRANLSELVLPFWSWMKIIKSLVFPLDSGYPLLQNEEILYVGAVGGLMGLIGLIWLIRKKNKEGKFWLLWLTFVLIVTLNIKTPLFDLIKWLPGFSLLRMTTRPWIFVSLAVALAVPLVIGEIRKLGVIRGKSIAALLMGLILLEMGIFDWRIFERRKIVKDTVPESFYQRMVKDGISARVYCTTGCIDRLKAQNMEIALIGGNNPIQLTEFVNYLQKAGGYQEKSYHPILPPYTVFDQQPQPSAELLGQTSTRYVVSSYDLEDTKLELIDEKNGYRLYENKAAIMPFSDHYFSVLLPGKS